MTFQYVSVDEVIKRSGVRMWWSAGAEPVGEAAKGILRVKKIEWARCGWFTTASR